MTTEVNTESLLKLFVLAIEDIADKDLQITKLKIVMSELLRVSQPLSNAAYNMAWDQKDWQRESLHKNVQDFDTVKRQAYKLLQEDA